MNYQSINVSHLLRKITFNDVLFNGAYTLDVYQNCAFGCIYCDSSYDETIYIKKNAIEAFKEDIKLFEKGRIIIGSVHDPYQPIEQKEELTRGILQIIEEQDIPAHILTKSPLILRDLDILTRLNDIRVTMTILSIDPRIVRLFEENAPSPKDRFQTMKQLSYNDITTGIALIPILPYLTDNSFEETISMASQFHAAYLIYKYLELKGDQKQKVFSLLDDIDVTLLPRYGKLYYERYSPSNEYMKEINKKIEDICKRYHLSSYSVPIIN
ncbi:MAG: radical SAM protein [Candidatus Thermoplasmatota archaeon]|nr:radical SAM protein [Candidatus Thermoplasmatota archaeon]